MTKHTMTVNDFRRMKETGERITALTAYDALMAGLLDEAGIDLILVGDSLGNVFQGRDTTLPVTIEDMIYHGEIVARAAARSFVAVDMPFMSYQVTPEDGVRNAGLIVKKTGCAAVKLEGGVALYETLRRIVDIGIPVLGHVGMTPQSVNVFGGYGIQGKDNRQKIINDARAVEDAGAFAVVLEKIPSPLAAELTGMLSIPTIGIGAGLHCDGQILVTDDVLGLFRKFKPRFVRRYAELAEAALEGLKNYCEDVRNGTFPGEEESYE